MRLWRFPGQEVLAALLCLSLLLWSVLPQLSHVPRIADTLQDHARMVADHGHSHGFAEDLLWALHGHSHDAADHDHGHEIAAMDEGAETWPDHRDGWLSRALGDGPHRIFRVERPPRA